MHHQDEPPTLETPTDEGVDSLPASVTLDKLPDLVLVSSDRVIFYAHTSRLIEESDNAFNGTLRYNQTTTTNGTSLPVPENADVLSVVLHAIYSKSYYQDKPSLETLLSAVRSLKSYGVPLARVVGPSTYLYGQILAQTPENALEVFIVAAQIDHRELASASSAYLHSLQITTISDETAIQMGGVYLKRFILLQMDRERSLERLLSKPPPPHDECQELQKDVLSEEWTLMASKLTAGFCADLPEGKLRSAMGSIEKVLWCDFCKEALHARIEEITVHWTTMTKVSVQERLKLKICRD
ncbi:hypothetical protein BXZ70DRAFT_1002631 [Cristinia sonorae]|uniref:BTB domain-containing protein n=1 Tax=Cristinia sonorae TaxID=1940300 RepID=A0A8K0XKE7_9AGAR|nr:hypothetical protein BXZ70DRAFT_1002631 [Cristinia sonorae]